MRKHWIVLIVVAAMSTVVWAGEDPPERVQAKEKKVRELLELTGAAQMGVQVMDRMLQQFEKMPGIAPEFLKRCKELVKPEELTETLIPIYVKHLDEKTLDATIAFYRTPEGRRLIQALPKIMEESMVVGQEWGQRIARKAMKELRNAPAREDGYHARRAEDMTNARNLAGLLAIQRETPMRDGRVDVYALVRKGDLPERHFSMFRSARFGYGPSKEEIEKGDYKKFPYERFRGVVDRNKTVPLLWDRKPDRKNGRVVAFSNGVAKYYAETEFQELLKTHGQLPQNPPK